MRKLLPAATVLAAVLVLVSGCGPEKAEVPATFRDKPDKPPVGAGAAPVNPGKGAGGKGGAADL